jgi:hypothetical protein
LYHRKDEKTTTKRFDQTNLTSEALNAVLKLRNFYAAEIERSNFYLHPSYGREALPLYSRLRSEKIWFGALSCQRKNGSNNRETVSALSIHGICTLNTVTLKSSFLGAVHPIFIKCLQ